ncbi:hypothetical protein PF010_g30757 [Phytophthora fragariae]|uniref:Uncharacterized protein n=1 Tax=Phytophthora fragariae TaxID=53985 RepID=A0A6A3PV60_9STRA|nr:hypothetical protein PF010_g30757 [Phytophthora fragariae]KAE9063588.1 hypothetical protein PF006_g30907 [Phytophthora fragariae]
MATRPVTWLFVAAQATASKWTSTRTRRLSVRHWCLAPSCASTAPFPTARSTTR